MKLGWECKSAQPLWKTVDVNNVLTMLKNANAWIVGWVD